MHQELERTMLPSVESSRKTPVDTSDAARLRDGLLIQRIRAGETELFEDLIEPYLRATGALVRSVLRDARDAEDTLQQSVLRAFSSLPQLRSAWSFRAWFFEIAVNEARMLRRRNARRRVDLPLDEADIDARPQFRPWIRSAWHELPSTLFAHEELGMRIRKAVRDLPSKYRDVFVLLDLEEQGTQETAEALGVSVAAVKARLHRARHQLRAKLRPPWSRPERESSANRLDPWRRQA